MALKRSNLPAREPLLVMILLFVVLALSGGASRADVFAQTIARLAGIAGIAWTLWWIRPEELRAIRVPLALGLLFLLLMVAQLVLLPPAIWMALPGRELFAELAPLLGTSQPWRPISVTPDLTINSALSMIVPLAALLMFARIRRDDWLSFVTALIGLMLCSALMGILQISGGGDALYLYRITNEGSAVGFFANRNHQAVLLVIAIPFLVTYATYPRRDQIGSSAKIYGACLGLVILVPLILITGSRLGLVLMLVAGVGAAFIALGTRRAQGARPPAPRSAAGRRTGRRRQIPQLWGWLAAGAIVAVVVMTVVLARAEAIQRVFTQDISQESRAKLFGTITAIAEKYFPVGSGFGSFETVFRIDEPFGNLSPIYLNHAHIDVLELVVEGGLAAIAIAMAFAVWAGSRGIDHWRGRGGVTPQAASIGKLGTLVVLLLILASLSDYPLRTPLLAALMAIGAGFLAVRSSPRTAAPSASGDGDQRKSFPMDVGSREL